MRYSVWIVGSALAALLFAATTTIVAAAEKSPEKKEPVRKLAVMLTGEDSIKLSATQGVTEATTAEELKKHFGEALARQLGGNVDFAKEKVVYVGWGSSGPPFDTLEYEIKETKSGKTVSFYAKSPKVNVRGQAYKLGSDFFAVPKDHTAEFRK